MASDEAAPVIDLGPTKWEPSIRAFEARDRQAPPPADAVLFVGSSTIVGWDLARWFPDLVTINRGFGGSQLHDTVYFVERIVLPYRPRHIVVYAGDNDLNNGRAPERIGADLTEFLARIRPALPTTPLTVLGTKPSRKLWHLIDQIWETNRYLREAAALDALTTYVPTAPVTLDAAGEPRDMLFKEDGMHLTEEGYRVWTELLRPYLPAADRPGG